MQFYLNIHQKAAADLTVCLFASKLVNKKGEIFRCFN